MQTVTKGAAATGALALAYAAGVERRWYAERHETLEVLRSSAALAKGGSRHAGPFRILFFSDLHHAPWQRHRLEFVRRVAESCKPDLVVSGGDNLEHPDAIDPVIALHRDVLAATGAPGLAILGAHDRFGPRISNPAGYLFGPSGGPGGQPLDTARLVQGFTEGGWQVLQNCEVSLDTRVGRIQVTGLDDPHIDRDDLSAVTPSNESEDSDVALRLGLVHAPYLRALHAFDRAGFDLALAGHTHGGQLAVPGWGALVTNCDLPASKARGTSWVGADLRLHVSAGLGHSVYFPVRFACRPELTVLDLIPR